MQYIINPKDKFKFACMRIIDSGGNGYVRDLDGKIYSVVQSKRMATPIKEESILNEINKNYFN